MTLKNNAAVIQNYPSPDVHSDHRHFCLTKSYRNPNTRWEFWVRFDDDKGVSHEEQHSADTEVELDTQRLAVVMRLRSKGLTPCDCGCKDLETLPEI